MDPKPVRASRTEISDLVTVAMERVEFLVPIHVGDLVVAEAVIHRAGRTSMDIGVEVSAERLGRGERRRTNSCLVTMVAVDEAGRPSPVPPLALETPEERQRAAAAQARRRSL